MFLNSEDKSYGVKQQANAAVTLILVYSRGVYTNRYTIRVYRLCELENVVPPNCENFSFIWEQE